MAKKVSPAPKRISTKEAIAIIKRRAWIGLRRSFLPIILAIVLVVLLIITAEVTLADKFFPRVFIGDTNLSLLTKTQASQILDSKFSQRIEQPVPLNYQGKIYSVSLATASANIDTQKALDQAMKLGHTGNLQHQLMEQGAILIFGANVSPEISLKLQDQFENINKQILIPPKNATLVLEDSSTATGSAQVKVLPGENGFGLDQDSLTSQLKNYLVFGQAPSQLPTKSVDPAVTTAEAKLAKQFLDSTNKEVIRLSFENSVWAIDTKTLITLLDLGQSEDNIISKDKLTDYLQDIAKKVNQPVKEAQFSFDPASSKVTAFTSSQQGRELDVDQTAHLITLALQNKGPKKINLPVKIVEPKIKNEEVNNLGIKELIGRGVSNFAGSIPNRMYNIGLAASRINGVLIPPGETFSFNATNGDISAATGYKQAYVIKSGRTVLDDGGGVCQVSTTVFRAALNAGLPIPARTAHAYRVGYYEQGYPPGLDATVFYPSVDFKFQNDTPAHVLIQAYVSGTTLYVDLYGTSDGRVATLTRPVVTGVTPAPPELRQDDPTLPVGEVKQVDFAANGANVVFSRTVTRGGETLIQESFRSNYKPWQAVFLVGTKEG